MTIVNENSHSVKAARAALDSAISHHFAGEFDHALPLYEIVLSLGYREVDVLPLVAQVAEAVGDEQKAVDYWHKLLVINPDHLVGLLELGLLLHKMKRYKGAVNCFDRVCQKSPDHIVALNNLAVVLLDDGQRDRALSVFQSLARLEPSNAYRKHQVRRVTSTVVPFWHIPMLNDSPRNIAFESAIIKAVSTLGPDAKVLDIGTGSGLLSMMAVRAGAKHVTTCEMVNVIADTALLVINDNDLADRISVINKSSTDLVVGEDLSERADILISEILSSDLLAEHVLPTFEDARKRLLKEDAIVIPRKVKAVGCLVESDVLHRYSTVDEVSGFKLSSFNALAPQRLPVHGTMTNWNRLSLDVDLVSIDLTAEFNPPRMNVLSIEVTASGKAVGMLQWMDVDLADEITFNNHPDIYVDGGWLQILHTFSEPIQVEKGQVIQIATGHDRTSLVILKANQ